MVGQTLYLISLSYVTNVYIFLIAIKGIDPHEVLFFYY